MMDILTCINKIHLPIFSPEVMYAFERELQNKHPENHNIKT